MAYANKYRLPLLNPGVAGVSDSETAFSIIIQERDYSGAETILKGNTDVGILKYFDSDEMRYAPIQSSELYITFYSENNFSLEDVISEDDYQFRVLISIGGYNGTTFEDRPVWFGFLDPDGCFEPAQDDPKEIRLKATDGLGFLKSEVLYDKTVYEKQTLLQLIETCLSFTGQEIPLLIECSVFDESMTDRTIQQESEPFSQCLVHTRTFLADTNTYKNPYEVLESIMTAFQCSLFQQNGRWQIMRKHDRWNQEMNLGTILSYPYTAAEPETSEYDYAIPVDQISRFAINADMIKGYLGASKYSKITYLYDVPDQVPRNSNFTSGSFLAPASTVGLNATRIDYWRYEKGADTSPSPVTSVPYLARTYDPDTGKELESYIILPRESGPNTNERLVSERVEVSANDTVTVSGMMRWRTPFSANVQVFTVRITLIRPNGQRLYINGVQGLFGPDWIADPNAAWRVPVTGETMNEWVSFDVRTPGFPFEGEVEIAFRRTDLGEPPNQTWYKSISFDWGLFVNGVTQVKGEYDTLIKDGSYRNTSDEKITIGDAPKKIISGALFRSTNPTQLTANWHRQGKVEAERLIRLNDIAIRQATHRLYTKLDGTFLGITYQLLDAKQLVGPANLFYFPKSPLKEKYYLPTNLEISLGQNTFRSSLQEFFDKTKDNEDPQGDQKDFQYMYQ